MPRPQTGLFLLLLAIGVHAAATAQENPAQGDATGAAAPDTSALAYRIGAGDLLQIDVWKEPDASCPSVTVRPDGKISLPIIGEVRAAGLTPAELQQALAEKFGQSIAAAMKAARPAVRP